MNTARGTLVRLMTAAAAAVAVLCAGILSPVRPAFAATFVPITGAGSTWSMDAIQAWITDVIPFGMTVRYDANGSTAGRSLFKAGQADWAASEIPYGVQDGSNFDPPPTRGYPYVPDLAGATTFMYNLYIAGQRVTNLRLSGAVVAGIFTNQITPGRE